jgi:exosortase A-associated hydrolase 2
LVAIATLRHILEEPIFFNRGSVRLFGVVHQPASTDDRRTPFVFCHPMAEEKLWAHRVFVSFARELARRGHWVLRFDCAGNGDSDLEFTDSSLSTAAADLAAGIDLLREKTNSPRISLLGLRLGASLAYQVAATRNDVEDLVLWAPIVDGSRYLQEMLRINLTTQMAAFGEVREDRAALTAALQSGQSVNVDGYEFSKTMAAELEALALLKAPAAKAARTLIAQIDRGPAAVSRELQDLQSRLSTAAVEVVQEDPFWKEIVRYYDSAPKLFERTLQWLDRSGNSLEER